MPTGNCKKHGIEFELIEGCPQCVDARWQEVGEHISRSQEGVDELRAETALALRPGEDLEAHNYHKEAMKLLEYAKGRVVKTIEDNKSASDDLSSISKLKKLMLAKKREYLDPLKEQAEAIQETYSTLMDPILAADRITREKMLAFDAEQRRIRAEREEINRKRQEAAEAEMRLTGELSESVNLVEVTAEPAKSVYTDMGSSSTVDHWTYEIVDEALLPRWALLVDTAMLSAIAKKHHDNRPVTGVRFFCKKIIANRAK